MKHPRMPLLRIAEEMADNTLLQVVCGGRIVGSVFQTSRPLRKCDIHQGTRNMGQATFWCKHP